MLSVIWRDTTGANIFAQDEPTFYKDEGGKSQELIADVALNRDNPRDATPINLEVSLSYEHEGPLRHCITERQGEFIKFDKKHYEISVGKPTCTIRFRLLKVSRNFNNKRFIVNIRVGEEEHGSPPICVKSKRKRTRETRHHCPPAKRHEEDLSDIRKMLHEIRREIREIKDGMLAARIESTTSSFYDIMDKRHIEVDW